MSQKRWFPIIAFMLFTAWGGYEARPFVQILSGNTTCCLECKRNYCPAKKPETFAAIPSCHTQESGTGMNKISRSCNHSSIFQMLHPDAVLVQLDWSQDYRISLRDPVTAFDLILITEGPPSPPPKAV